MRKNSIQQCDKKKFKPDSLRSTLIRVHLNLYLRIHILRFIIANAFPSALINTAVRRLIGAIETAI